MKIPATVTINVGLYMDIRPEIEITVPDGLENRELVRYLHKEYFGLLTPQFREDPEIVRGNELLEDLKNPLLSEADRKSLKRIHSAKSERQKMFFAKDEAQKNSFDYDNKDYHSAQEIHGAMEEHQKTFDPANEAILAERNT